MSFMLLGISFSDFFASDFADNDAGWICHEVPYGVLAEKHACCRDKKGKSSPVRLQVTRLQRLVQLFDGWSPAGPLEHHGAEVRCGWSGARSIGV